MKRIVCTSQNFGKHSLDLIKLHLSQEKCDLIWLNKTEPITNENELIELIADYEAVISYSGFDAFSKYVIESSPQLKIISRHGIGYDSIDLETATRRGVYVCTTHKGANEERAVADLTIALLLALTRRIIELSIATKSGKWERPLAFDLWGKNLGIIGMGKIGKAVAVRAKTFGLHIKAFDLNKDTAFAKRHEVEYIPLNELLSTSDYVTIHTPLTKETKGMIGHKEISLMKQGSFLINCARAPIIDTQALFEALRDKHLAGAGLDVYHSEPPHDDPLLSLENVIAMPHVAAYTVDTIQAMDMITLKACTSVLNGHRPDNIINNL